MNKIIRKEFLNKSVCKMIVEAPFVANKAKAGQFIIIRALSDSERIPLIISDFNKEEHTISIIFDIDGKSTFELSKLSENDYICDLVGPLGTPSKIDESKNILFVVDGITCATALPIIKMFKEQGANIDILAEFKDKENIILESELSKLSDSISIITKDEDCEDIFDKLEKILSSKNSYDKVMTMGSLEMMKNVCDITKKYNIHTIVSMNSIMVDGTGMCGSCRVTVGGETKFACVEGPEFDGHLIDFDEAINRLSMYTKDRKREDKCNLLNKEVE